MNLTNYSSLKIKLDKDAIMPKKAHTTDAGFDLYSRDTVTIEPHKAFCFDTGVHIDICEGLVGFLKSKSGLNCKFGIQGEGVIDAGYTGSIVIKLYNNSDIAYTVNKGDKISQIVFLYIPNVDFLEVDSLDYFKDSDRGENGFGSSGK